MPRNLINGSGKADTLTGTSQSDVINGRGGDDAIDGLKGNDRLSGGDGDDTLDGGFGNDRLDAGEGDDQLVVSGGADILIGGGGLNTLDASTWKAGVWLNLNTFNTTDFNTTATGSSIQVAAGTMKLRDAGPSVDWVVQTVSDINNFIGSASRDFVYFRLNQITGFVDMRDGDDSFTAGAVDKVLGGRGNDSISVASGTVDGGKGDDRLSASAIDDVAELLGGLGNDTLIFRGNTIAKGGAGNDILSCIEGERDQRIFGGSGADIFRFSGGTGSGVMQDFVAGVDRIDLTGYSLTDPSVTWETLQTMFEPGEGGIRIRMDSDRYSNQLFTFVGLKQSDLSESDFIL
jgi:Ca2+-binding RTX toxin-like protein